MLLSATQTPLSQHLPELFAQVDDGDVILTYAYSHVVLQVLLSSTLNAPPTATPVNLLAQIDDGDIILTYAFSYVLRGLLSAALYVPPPQPLSETPCSG